VLSWFGTLWNSKIQLNTAMLFALGFVSLFLSGGVSGIVLARNDLAAASISDEFVTGHFHLVMGIAATFGMLGALFFWFPKMFARRLNEPLGKLHFWLTFAGVYCVFMPMHWLGLMTHWRASASVFGTNTAAVDSFATPFSASLRTFVTAATILTVAAQSLFLINFFWSLWRGEEIEHRNPWRATTLEWTLPSPVPAHNFGMAEPVVFRGAYEFTGLIGAEDFTPQNIVLAQGEPPLPAKQLVHDQAKEN
jgi:cytochrome c oxidase subunit 1